MPAHRDFPPRLMSQFCHFGLRGLVGSVEAGDRRGKQGQVGATRVMVRDYAYPARRLRLRCLGGSLRAALRLYLFSAVLLSRHWCLRGLLDSGKFVAGPLVPVEIAAAFPLGKPASFAVWQVAHIVRGLVAVGTLRH